MSEQYHVEWAFLDNYFVPHSRGLSIVRVVDNRIYQESATVTACCQVNCAVVTTLAVRWSKDHPCPSVFAKATLGATRGVLLEIGPQTLFCGDTATPSWDKAVPMLTSFV